MQSSNFVYTSALLRVFLARMPDFNKIELKPQKCSQMWCHFLFCIGWEICPPLTMLETWSLGRSLWQALRSIHSLVSIKLKGRPEALVQHHFWEEKAQPSKY